MKKAIGLTDTEQLEYGQCLVYGPHLEGGNNIHFILGLIQQTRFDIKQYALYDNHRHGVVMVNAAALHGPTRDYSWCRLSDRDWPRLPLIAKKDDVTYEEVLEAVYEGDPYIREYDAVRTVALIRKAFHIRRKP